MIRRINVGKACGVGVLRKEVFIQILDDIYNIAVSAEDETDDARVEFLLEHVAIGCLAQGHAMAKSAYEKDHLSMPDQMYRGIQAGYSCWELARHHLETKYQIEIDPLFYMLLLRGTYNKSSSAEFDKCMRVAFDRFSESIEKELESAFETHEVIDPNSIDPDTEITPETLQRFFTLFREIESFHRNRDEYSTDDERRLHDELMTIYHTIKKQEVQKDEQ